MKANQLRQRIQVFQQILGDDTCLGVDETFVSKGSCWAEVKSRNPAINDEQFHDRRIVAVKQYNIKTRFNIGFSFEETDIIVFKGNVLRIQGITNVIDHDFQFQIMCHQIERDSVKFGGLLTQAAENIFTQVGEPVFDQLGA